jgi:PGF-CTERM protein
MCLIRPIIRYLILAAGSMALFALLAGAASAASCVNGDFATNGYGDSWDREGDGFNDSATVGLRWPGDYTGATIVQIDVALEYTNGTTIDANISGAPYYMDYANTTFLIAVVHMGVSNQAGDVIMRASMSEGGIPCDWANYTLFLFPAGRFEPTISAAAPSLEVDLDGEVTYEVRVGSLGNLPDKINLTANSSSGWDVRIFPDNVSVGPGNFTTVNVTVRGPHNAPPLAEGTTTVTAWSATDAWVRREYDPEGAANASLTLVTTVRAQVFHPQLSSAAASLTTPPGTTTHFTVTLRNGGNNHDVFTLSAQAAPTGWTIEVFPTTLALDYGTNATFAVNVSTPTALTGLLVWSPVITATSGDAATRATLTLEAHLELPDFALTATDISVSQAHPRVGDAVPVIVTVRNLGLQLALDTIVSLSDGTTNQTTTVSIGITGTGIATFSWAALAGTTTLTATADSSRSIPESNEANNAASVSVTANAPPTAAVSNATATAKTGEAVTLSAAGSSDGDGSVAAYYFDFGDGTNSDWVTTPTVTHTYSTAGTFTAKIRVRDNAGAESANTTATVTVSAAAASSPPTPGFEAALGLAAMGAVAWVAIRRRS